MGLLGARVSSEGGNLTEKLPSPTLTPSLPPFLPSSLLCSLPPSPVPSSLLASFRAWQLPSRCFTSSPAPIPKNGVGVSRATKLYSQHLYPPWLLLNWPQRTKEGGGKPDPPKTSLQLHHPGPPLQGGFCIPGAGQTCPGLNSLSSLRGCHTQVSRCNSEPRVLANSSGLLRSQTNF